MKKITVGEIRAAIGGELLFGDESVCVTGVEMDSRVMKTGDCFFALPGERVDGNDFVQAAFARGAVCAVVTDRAKAEKARAALPQSEADACAAILTDDAEKALRDLAAWYIRGFRIKKIAVTGSNGKTTTKDMIYAVCSRRYKTHKTPVNRNNLIGLPLTVLGLSEDDEVAVFEMGMDHAGEIHEMARIVQPDVAVITNVGVAHIERLGSRENILAAKLEIRDFFGSENTLLIAEGDLLTREAAQGNYRLESVGETGKSDYIVSEVQNRGEDGMEFSLEKDGVMRRYRLSVPGEYNVTNAALAIAAAERIGVSPEEAQQGLLAFRPAEKRMDIRGANGIKVIDDTYNASPPAMKAAIDVLMNTKGVRRVAVLGDMFELGRRSAEYHREVGRYAAQRGVDMVIGVGSLAAFLCEGAAETMDGENVLHFADKEAFSKRQRELIGTGDVVLVKGSRGMAMETIVKKILG